MKLFSKSMAVALFLGGATLLQVAGVLSCHRNLQKPGDLELRYNESLCAHRGINPFKIWNRELRHNDFRGLVRPDRQNDNDKNKRMVHAYPPWHTVYTWFYGDLPWSFVVAIMYFMCGISVATLCCRLMTMQPNSYCTFYWSWNLLFIFPAMVSCLVWGNYGIVCAGLLLIIAKLFRTSHQIALGVAWGIMMIKPQIATLLIFPLLFTKKILAVFTAIVICAFSTLFLAYIYSESPISLIMQIPQIGAPYDTSVFFRKLLPSSCVP
ncbi:MAG: DUF2029 domain-containing protein, partial [Victivallales bacterium]|nr:DUF2029 domain-containing protein [Victivallales bacterium]